MMPPLNSQDKVLKLDKGFVLWVIVMKIDCGIFPENDFAEIFIKNFWEIQK